MRDKHTAVWNWLMQCHELKDMYFNFGKAENGNTVLVPETAYSDTWKDDKQTISGEGIRYYDFAIVQFKAAVTEPNNTENIDILLDVEKIAAWVDEQEGKGNYPKFSGPEKALEVKVLESPSGYLAGQDKDGAKYMLQIRIEYLYEKGN